MEKLLGLNVWKMWDPDTNSYYTLEPKPKQPKLEVKPLEPTDVVINMISMDYENDQPIIDPMCPRPNTPHPFTDNAQYSDMGQHTNIMDGLEENRSQQTMDDEERYYMDENNSNLDNSCSERHDFLADMQFTQNDTPSQGTIYQGKVQTLNTNSTDAIMTSPMIISDHVTINPTTLEHNHSNGTNIPQRIETPQENMFNRTDNQSDIYPPEINMMEGDEDDLYDSSTDERGITRNPPMEALSKSGLKHLLQMTDRSSDTSIRTTDSTSSNTNWQDQILRNQDPEKDSEHREFANIASIKLNFPFDRKTPMGNLTQQMEKLSTNTAKTYGREPNAHYPQSNLLGARPRDHSQEKRGILKQPHDPCKGIHTPESVQITKKSLLRKVFK